MAPKVLHMVLPESVDDPRRPSGGNLYDRRLCAALSSRGHDVDRILVADAPGDVAAALAALPDRTTVLLDGLVASAAAEAVLAETTRLHLVVLVHLPFGTPGEADLFRAVARLVTTSEWTREWLLREYGVPPDRIRVAVPGADEAPLALASPDGRRLLCVAPVTTLKGYDELVAALVMLAELPWTLTAVGALDLDPSCTERVRDTLAAAGLADRVQLTGPLGEAECDAAYAAADLLVVPSHIETYGMVVTEALARGLPVVATEVGGVPEAMGGSSDGRPGLLVPPRSPADLVDALRRWLTEPGLRRRLRHAAAERRTCLPGWDETVAIVEQALDP